MLADQFVRHSGRLSHNGWGGFGRLLVCYLPLAYNDLCVGPWSSLSMADNFPVQGKMTIQGKVLTPTNGASHGPGDLE